jgi:hypothetical protein
MYLYESLHMIEDLGQDATLFDKGLPVYLDHDFEVADSGMLYLNSTLTVGDHDEVMISKTLYEIVDFVLDTSEPEYRELYAIANELEREAAKLRDVAQRIEDSDTNVADLFDQVYNSE